MGWASTNQNRGRSWLLVCIENFRRSRDPGWRVGRRAYLRPDMHLLITVAVISAMVISEWFEAATISFLFALSLTLESWHDGQLQPCLISLRPQHVSFG
jgi:cation transport ATPase